VALRSSVWELHEKEEQQDRYRPRGLHRLSPRAAELPPRHKVKVVHDGTAEMTEDKPEYRFENTLNFWCHGGRIAQ
jgi:hypothetical protein